MLFSGCHGKLPWQTRDLEPSLPRTTEPRESGDGFGFQSLDSGVGLGLGLKARESPAASRLPQTLNS